MRSRARVSAVSPRRGSGNPAADREGAGVTAGVPLAGPSIHDHRSSATPASATTTTPATASAHFMRLGSAGALGTDVGVSPSVGSGTAGTDDRGEPCSSRFRRSRTARASSDGAPRVIAARNSRRASSPSPRSNAATPCWSSSSDSRWRSASALRARSIYARARGWLRSRKNARDHTSIACSYSAEK